MMWLVDVTRNPINGFDCSSDGRSDRVVVVTGGFGGRHWAGAAQRLALQARASGWFSNVIVWDQGTLQIADPAYANWSDSLPKRGFRLWSWKPVIVFKTLEYLLSASSAEYLLYLDAGFEINVSPAAQIRFAEYLDFAAREGALLMSTGYPEYAFMKTECQQVLGLSDDELAAEQLQAGLQLWQVSERSISIVGEWLDYCRAANGWLLRDAEPFEYDCTGEPIAHRHDQAILSGVAKKRGLVAHPNECYFGPNWEAAGENFPFWAMRNASRISYTAHDPLSKLRRMPDRVRGMTRARVKQYFLRSTRKGASRNSV